MSLLNLFKNHTAHYMFRLSLVIIRHFKTVLLRPLCLRVFPPNVGCVAPTHIRVFRGAACLLLPSCVFIPRVFAKRDWVCLLYCVHVAIWCLVLATLRILGYKLTSYAWFICNLLLLSLYISMWYFSNVFKYFPFLCTSMISIVYVILPTNRQLVPRSRKCGSLHPLPHTPSWRSA
jgi:hypothetical protein